MIWPVKKNPLITQEIILDYGDVFLRPAKADDCLEWLELRAKNQLYLRPYEPAWTYDALTPQFFMYRLELFEKLWRKDTGYGFLIFKQSNGRMIGGMNINNVTRGAAQYASLGYWLDEESQGRGYMTSAGMATLKFCFNDLQLLRVNAATLPHNDKSKKLLLRLGFTQEGFAKHYIQINGVREDHILFGLNKDDFIASDF